MAAETFNAIVSKATEVEQHYDDYCDICGLSDEECNCEILDDLASGKIEMP